MLSDFFRINFPYGIRKNLMNEWVCFNREYMPLGWNLVERTSIHDGEAFEHLPIYTAYSGITETKLLKLAIEPTSIRRDDSGDINMVFLYNDKTNPKSSPQYWNDYFQKIKLLAAFEIRRVNAF